MKKIAIIQSNYIPWKGYFDIINKVDEFVLYDDTQYTKRDWRNRNLIKTPNGTQWLTIPVLVKGKFEQKIEETLINQDSDWTKEHMLAFVHNYSKAAYFSEYRNWLSNLYAQAKLIKNLSEINYLFLSEICKILGIKTKISWSRNYETSGIKTERLLGICKSSNATHYLSGPAAKDYLDEKMFNDSGIAVEWMDYSNYAQYTQLFPPFTHGVTILDFIFNEGIDFNKCIKN